jgi:hypothetical protein
MIKQKPVSIAEWKIKQMIFKLTGRSISSIRNKLSKLHGGTRVDWTINNEQFASASVARVRQMLDERYAVLRTGGRR